MAFSRLRTSFGDQRGHSSAVSSVLYSYGTSSDQETKAGSYIYGGDASSFHEWEFRTRLRVKGRTEDRYAEAVSKVIDGLRGDAFIVAQEVGLDSLWATGAIDADTEVVEPTGIETLIAAMKTTVFPLTTHEAKELFRQYCKPVGSLSRQSGESMTQYVSRRKRCWKLLKELDPENHVLHSRITFCILKSRFAF